MRILVQTSKNNPLDVWPGKGEWVFTSTSTKWTDCTYNRATVSSIGSTAATFSHTWSQRTGGTPIAPVDPTEMLGIQLQFECTSTSSSGCAIDVTIDSVAFVQ
jgi:hypothetical protein